MRENSKEMKVNGYTIPAKSIIIQNIYSIHLSPKHWSEPNKFIPERFLDTDGNLVKSPALLAFGLGNDYVFHSYKFILLKGNTHAPILC